MLDKIDIINRLMNGESADDIAQEIATTLNEAEAEYKEAEAKRKEVEKEKAETEELKMLAIDDILNGLCDYLYAIKRNDLLEQVHKIKSAEIENIIDQSIKAYDALGNLRKLEFKLPIDGWPWDRFILND